MKRMPKVDDAKKIFGGPSAAVPTKRQTTIVTEKLPMDDETLNQRMAKVLRERFHHTAFRGDQQTVIRLVLQGKSVLFLAPTGGGKSLTYQLPAVMLPGVTVVVSPLIALMKDQVGQLTSLGIKAGFLGSAASKEEKSRLQLDLKCSKPQVKLVFVSPELLASPSFVTMLDSLHKRGILSFVAIDEAHCVSSWGHSFRPAFLRLALIRERYPQVPLLALTATATTQVRTDIINSLKMEPCMTLAQSVDRPNIEYLLRHKENLPGDQLFEDILSWTVQYPGSGIIYTHTRETAELLGSKLSKKVSIGVYHAGLKAAQRTQIQTSWMAGTVRVIVATIAFGMGIDKKDVRFVIHFNLPVSLEAYYQESGRCGRDGNPSTAILYYSQEDRMRGQYFSSLPEPPKKNQSKVVTPETKLKLFATMVRFCESGQCRREIILDYFGEKLVNRHTRCCDVCTDPAAAKESLAAAIATGKASELNVSEDLYIPLEEREHVSRSQQRRMGFRYSSEEEEYSGVDEGVEDVPDSTMIGFRSVGSIVAAAGTPKGRKEMFALFCKAEEEEEERRNPPPRPKKQETQTQLAGYKGQLLGVRGAHQVPELSLPARELCLSRLRDALRGDDGKAADLEFEVFSKAHTKPAYLEEARRLLGELRAANPPTSPSKPAPSTSSSSFAAASSFSSSSSSSFASSSSSSSSFTSAPASSLSSKPLSSNVSSSFSSAKLGVKSNRPVPSPFSSAASAKPKPAPAPPPFPSGFVRASTLPDAQPSRPKTPQLKRPKPPTNTLTPFLTKIAKTS